MVVKVEKIRVDILGLSTSSISSGAYALILQEVDGEQRRLPIVIGAFEAQAIAMELEGIKPPRPQTHDLLKSILEAFAVNVQEVVIHDLQDGTFYANIILDDGTIIDARPSDAIALAVRTHAPIYVLESVLEEAGFLPEMDEDLEEDEDEADFEEYSTRPQAYEREDQPLSELERLQRRLQKAIEEEDYELAAKIRDQIKQLEENQSSSNKGN